MNGRKRPQVNSNKRLRYVIQLQQRFKRAAEKPKNSLNGEMFSTTLKNSQNAASQRPEEEYETK